MSTHAIKVRLATGVDLSILLFNHSETRMIWQKEVRSGQHTMKVNACATYTDGLLSEFELNFWMSIKNDKVDHLGMSRTPYNIGYVYSIGEDGTLTANTIDLGRFNHKNSGGEISPYSGVEEKYKTLSHEYGCYTVEFPSEDGLTKIEVPVSIVQKMPRYAVCE